MIKIDKGHIEIAGATPTILAELTTIIHALFKKKHLTEDILQKIIDIALEENKIEKLQKETTVGDITNNKSTFLTLQLEIDTDMTIGVHLQTDSRIIKDGEISKIKPIINELAKEIYEILGDRNTEHTN